MDSIILFSVIWFWSFHFIFDFICQTRWQAENKYNNLDALSNHVFVYALGMALTTLIFTQLYDLYLPGSIMLGCAAAVYFYITHFFTDMVTSRFTHKYFKRKDYHMGFVIVGLDQLIHFVTIMIPVFYLVT